MPSLITSLSTVLIVAGSTTALVTPIKASSTHTLSTRAQCEKLKSFPFHWDDDPENYTAQKARGSRLPWKSTGIKVSLLDVDSPLVVPGMDPTQCLYRISGGWQKTKTAVVLTWPVELKQSDGVPLTSDGKPAHWDKMIELYRKIGILLDTKIIGNKQYAIVRPTRDLKTIDHTTTFTDRFGSQRISAPSNPSPADLQKCIQRLQRIYEMVVDQQIWYAEQKGILLEAVDFSRVLLTDDWSVITFDWDFTDYVRWDTTQKISAEKRQELLEHIADQQLTPYGNVIMTAEDQIETHPGYCKSGGAPTSDDEHAMGGRNSGLGDSLALYDEDDVQQGNLKPLNGGGPAGKIFDSSAFNW